MEKGHVVELYIEDMSSDGNGIGRTDGQVVFADGCVTGDTVRARITKAKKNYAFADCIEITEPSPFRNEGFCQFAGDCGGCPLGDLKYEKQLEMKEGWVREKLTRLGGLEEPVVRPIIGMEEPLRYRNKAVFAVSETSDVGFVRKKSHQVVDCQDCRIQTEAAMGVADALYQYLHAYKLKGAVKNLMVRTAPGTGEMMAVINTTKKDIPDLETLAGMLDEGSGYRLESIYINDRCIAGRKTILEETDGLKFEISTESFYQVNSEQMLKLYGKAMEYADLKGGETVLDLYCGVGTIGIFAAKEMKDSGRVIGIESVKPAVIDANRNSVINGLVSTRYLAGKAEEVLPAIMGLKPFMGYNEVNKLVEKEPPLKVEHADVVFLDPPRAGCEEELLNAVVQAAPDRIVYVSCDPATLARDIKYLTGQGYGFIEATPVDMFPHTGHVETVVLLRRDEKEEKKMISDEKSRYKSWSNLKSQMNDLLCDSLKDKIQYFYTTYHEVHNAYGRATINYNKKEMVAFSWVEMYAQEYEMSQLYKEGKKISYGEMEKKKWMPEGKLCEIDFINSITIYLKTDISSSLTSDNLLLRVFAYMDRRVGKRTLIRIKDDVEKLPEWVKQFYRLRCEAENINFQQNQTTDETVVLMTKK